MSNNINYELYKVFYSVVKNGSISHSAKELFLSQPAVSQSIKQLESQLGGKLFKRTPKGMELTSEGSAIFEYIERANGLIEQASVRFEQMKSLESGSIRIGASDNICRNFLLPYVTKFHELYPKIKIFFINGTSAQTVNLLRTGRIDVGFVNLPASGEDIDSTPVGMLHDCFVAGSGFIQLKDRPVTLKELLEYPIILLTSGTTSRMFIDEFFKRNELHADPSIEVGSHDLLIAFAKQNMGISCVTEEFVKKELSAGKLFKINIDGDVRSRNIGRIRLKNVTPSFAAARFMEIVESAARSEVARHENA